MSTYPNLSIDLSWVVFEDYIIQEDGPNPEVVRLIEAYPDRFVIGSDKVGKFHNYENETLKYYALLDALRPETATNVAHDNLLRLLPKK